MTDAHPATDPMNLVVDAGERKHQADTAREIEAATKALHEAFQSSNGVNPRSMLETRQGGRSLRAFAAEVGVSPMHLCDVYKGRREPGPKILSYLKLTKTVERVVTYRRIRG